MVYSYLCPSSRATSVAIVPLSGTILTYDLVCELLLLLLYHLVVLLPLWDSVIGICFVVRYFMSILVLQKSCWGRVSWLLYFICLPGVS